MSKHNSKQSTHGVKPQVRDLNSIVKPAAHQINPRLLVNSFAAVKECRLGLMMYNRQRPDRGPRIGPLRRGEMV